MTIASFGERALIERIRARVPHTAPDLLLDIGDDAALVAPPRNGLDVVTTDMLVEHVHFRREWSSPADIGAKAILVNVSDLYAMGARPRLALLSLALPAELPLADFDALIDGVADAARDARIAIAGGNLTQSPGPLIVDVTAMGVAHPRKHLRRDAGRAGDALWLTGTVGAAAAGLAWLTTRGLPPEGHPAWPAVRRACRPTPPLGAGLALARTGASRAGIDLSDGLADGVRRLAEGAGCGVQVDADALPIDPSARAICEELGLDPIETALRGDDYELLFAVGRRNAGRLRGVRPRLGTQVTRVGHLTPETDLTVVRAGAATALPDGFDHFSHG